MTQPPADANVPFEGATKPIGSTRSAVLRVGTYSSAAILLIGLLGLVSDVADDSLRFLWWLFAFGGAAGLAGVLFVLGGSTQKIEREYRENLDMLTDRFAMLSARDWVTGMLTRAEFVGALKAEISRSARYDRQTSIIVIRPHRRAITQVGNSPVAISAAANFMSDAVSTVLRETDTLARLDENFGVIALLPETDRTGAEVAGRRIQDGLSSVGLVMPGEESLSVPVSIALATYPSDATDAESLISKATDPDV